MTKAEIERLLSEANAGVHAALKATNEADALMWQGRALLLQRLLEVTEQDAGLQRVRRERNVNSAQMLSPQHTVALSESRPTKDKRFLTFIRARGYSLNRLAKAAKMSPAGLSQARRKPNDQLYRRVPDDKAKVIEKLTGWPASDWP